jgi:hypothetical protein
VRRRFASRRAPGYQVAAPSEQGEAARALCMALARARPASSMLGHWPAEPRGTRRGAPSSRGDFDPGSPPTPVCTGVKPGADPCVPLQVEGVDAVP